VAGGDTLHDKAAAQLISGNRLLVGRDPIILNDLEVLMSPIAAAATAAGKKTDSASDIIESRKKDGWDTPTENLLSFSENIETKRLESKMQFHMEQDFRCEQICQETTFRTEQLCQESEFNRLKVQVETRLCKKEIAVQNHTLGIKLEELVLTRNQMEHQAVHNQNMIQLQFKEL